MRYSAVTVISANGIREGSATCGRAQSVHVVFYRNFEPTVKP